MFFLIQEKRNFCFCDRILSNCMKWNNSISLLFGSYRDDRKDSRKPKKPYKYWDVPPPGYETMTPVQYKALQGDADYVCIVAVYGG